MTTPTPRHPERAEGPASPGPTLELASLTAATTPARERGPLVVQQVPAARLANILHHAAEELWDACTYDDAAQMWEEARAIASRILASCPGD